MEASFVEIYNEEIRDLLATEKGLKYDIKRVDTKSTEIYVTNLKVEDVSSGDNVNPLLRRAKKNRAVAATNCNERSSRYILHTDPGFIFCAHFVMNEAS